MAVCILSKKSLLEGRSNKWYQEISHDPKIIFAYENESTYLNEYETFKKNRPDIFSYASGNRVIEMAYYERIQGIDFDEFYAFIREHMEEKKYGVVYQALTKHITSGSITNPLHLSLLYYQLGKCKEALGFDQYEIIRTYEEAVKCDHRVLMPLYELMVKHRLAGLYEHGIHYMEVFFSKYGTPSLFDDPHEAYDDLIEYAKKNPYLCISIYTYLYFLEFEAIICYLHHAEFIGTNSKTTPFYEVAYQLCNRLMMRKMVIADESMKQINHFKARCIEHVKDRFISYPEEKIRLLTEKHKHKQEEKEEEKRVIFTITTCKRFDLFEKTMNSLIHCTKDIDMIGEWLCVDDNSSEADRAAMKERYPFFTFIFKTPEERGHSRSMNIIRDYVVKSGYAYTLHMEDDWVAVCEMEYLKPSIEIIMESQEGVRQVVQNRQYVQLIRSRDIDLKGGFQRYLKSGMRYILHEFYPKGSHEESEFWKRNGGGFSASYWPHYSLNPSVMSTDVYKCLGNYREDVRHFEMEYASRYTNAGFKTAFLDGIYRLHIGKLIGEEGKKNAYELNNLVQFSEKS